MVTDLAWGRIFNWMTLPLFFTGLVVSFNLYSWSGLTQALLGALVGLAFFGPLFFFGVMGGGDVKYMLALGALGGAQYSIEVALLSIVLGGVFGFLLLLFTGKLPDFFRRMYFFLMTLAVREMKAELPALNRKLTMPFGIPLAVAAVWVDLRHPLEAVLSSLVGGRPL